MPVKRSFSMQTDGPPGGTDKPKRTWMEIITIDMKTCNLYEDLGKALKMMKIMTTTTSRPYSSSMYNTWESIHMFQTLTFYNTFLIKVQTLL